jgi:hypothetical protein
MTQEDKELILKDLCARLPYNCRVFYEYVDNLDGKTYGYSLTLNTWCINEFIANKAVVKPYLRPMSSMTKEERKYFQKLAFPYDFVDALNANYFDYRGLIPKGLALKAPADMYKID